MVIDFKKRVFDFLCGMNMCIMFGGKNKKGEMEVDEIIKIVFVLIVIVVMIGGVVILFRGKGGRLMASIRDTFRFGG